MAAFHYIHCIVMCKCGNRVNIRAKFGKTVGWVKSEPCWNCPRAVELRNRQGWCENERRPTEFISEEVKHE